MIPGVGGPELLIILVAGLLIFGPGKLPEVAGQMGRAVRDFRRMTTDLTGEFEKSLNEAGATDLRNTVNTELRGMKAQVENVGKSVERDLGVGKGTAAKSSSVAKSTSSAKSTTSASKTTTVKSTGAAGKTTPAAKVAAGGTSKPSTSTSSASTVSKAKKAEPAVASKANPLADLLVLDDGGDTPSPAPARTPTVPASKVQRPAAATPTPAPSGLSAVERARQRRQAAGYNRAQG